jgi:heme A synthase
MSFYPIAFLALGMLALLSVVRTWAIIGTLPDEQEKRNIRRRQKFRIVVGIALVIIAVGLWTSRIH